METQIVISESYAENKDKYRRTSHMVGISMWEFEWKPKYAYSMFRKWKYKKLAEACIRRAASLHKIKWIELNVQPDHVQGTAEIPFTMSPSMALQYLKGLSAKLFFEYHPKARKRYPKGSFWNDGYFCVGCGSDFDRAFSYIQNQELHHFS